MSEEKNIAQKSRFGRDYLASEYAKRLPPDNLEEILKRTQIQEQIQGSQGIYSNLLSKPMITSYKSYLEALKAKRARGIVSMMG
ncbi:hypothetical protein KEJ36_00390 [Candidatus Bathyarchaeota archaeon]|nr:hypothetical protein [Candidatus Bathyarchaeota archaeon]MBS7627281.1 hypothetical protein [Candidatus Bathyarchaeota archaeon]